MAKVTKLDKTSLKLIQQQLLAAMTAEATKLGVSVSWGSGSFESHTATLKLIVSTADAGDVQGKKEAHNFALYAPMMGLKPEHFGREFIAGNQSHRIVGLALGRAKFPVICLREDGTRRVFTAAFVAQQMGD